MESRGQREDKKNLVVTGKTYKEVVMGYLNVFCKTKDYYNALALVDWALAFYPGLKNSEKRIT